MHLAFCFNLTVGVFFCSESERTSKKTSEYSDPLSNPRQKKPVSWPVGPQSRPGTHCPPLQKQVRNYPDSFTAWTYSPFTPLTWNGDMGINAVCRVYGVPKKTLKRRLAGTNTYATDSKQVFGRPQDLQLSWKMNWDNKY
ncbi:hypothetical protein J6590_021419 [Homalodisca vitripennis]|nr:hypothetical protein J6590_021419 [Homalodisca vitripennis]